MKGLDTALAAVFSQLQCCLNQMNYCLLFCYHHFSNCLLESASFSLKPKFVFFHSVGGACRETFDLYGSTKFMLQYSFTVCCLMIINNLPSNRAVEKHMQTFLHREKKKV